MTHISLLDRNVLGSKIYLHSRLLEKPLERCGRNVMWLLSPFPSEPSNIYSFCEIAQRIRKFIEIPLLFPLALMAVPFSLASRLISSALVKENFFYLKGDAEEKTQGDAIGFAQQNICAAGFASYFAGAVSFSPHRIDAIIGKYKKPLQDVDQDAQDQPDVILFQEVYDTYAVNRIFQRCKDDYAHFYFGMGFKPPQGKGIIGKLSRLNPFHKPSGLMVMSKREITNAQFHSFGDIPGAQKSVNKGFFEGIVSTEKGKIPFVVTHLQPSIDDSLQSKSTEELAALLSKDKDAFALEKNIRHEELKRIKDSITFLRDPKDPAYVFADFNIAKGGLEADASITGQGFIYAGDDDAPTEFKEVLLKDRLFWFQEKRENSLLFDQSPEDLGYNFDFALCLPPPNDANDVPFGIDAHVSKVIKEEPPMTRLTALSDHSAVFRTITPIIQEK